ncbi:MAG: hypothetical protein ACOWWO_19230, partial [Peptococcaceae bacterium]
MCYTVYQVKVEVQRVSRFSLPLPVSLRGGTTKQSLPVSLRGGTTKQSLPGVIAGRHDEAILPRCHCGEARRSNPSPVSL